MENKMSIKRFYGYREVRLIMNLLEYVIATYSVSIRLRLTLSLHGSVALSSLARSETSE